MPTDKEVKKSFKAKASKDPDKYYATSVLKKEGFTRKKCKCGTYFWTVNSNQDNCGDPSCYGEFRFIGEKVAKNKLSYIEVWQKFSLMFKKLGYTPIKRYPVVSRWRDDMDFVIASIADFQPYVVSGEVDPPANPLVVPQFCLRFGDIDNVGITGSHMTCFNMIGQHMFVTPDKWDQDKVFQDIKKWLNDGLGLSDSEITFHEDVWAGGGNFGPCMEFFSRGVEIGNQVYMLYEQSPTGPKELKLKVLDMGMGMERCAWFTQGTPTIYDAVFPTVVKKLFDITGIKPNKDLLKKYVPYAGALNIDEIDDIDKSWDDVAKKVGVDVKTLKQEVFPMAALYSIAEHSRGLLIALSDGALPSNVGGGYNLRIILRRALSFIDKYNWKIDLGEICELHAKYLKPLFPELSENLEEVKTILAVEKKKYLATKEKTKHIVSRQIKKDITVKHLCELYDCQGISPEIIKEEASKLNKKVDVPEDFYARVAELHEKKEQVHATKKEDKLPLDNISDTDPLYFDDYMQLENKAKVLKIIKNCVVLDKTVAYPTSGGQIHDKGTINDDVIVDVFKQGAIIVHLLKDKPNFKVGETVTVKIQERRRRQLAQHHTATHIINAAARKVLGNHIYQAGAKKTEEKAHLDVTHFENITPDEIKKIEAEANKVVSSDLKVNSFFLPRSDAEKKYGMRLYQGGAVPGKKIRIIDIMGEDVEACGGTHLKKTSEVGAIKIIKTNKIQDGVVRITFTAGKAMEKEESAESNIMEDAAKLLGVKTSQVPKRTEELFDKWKTARKAAKKKQKIDLKELELTSTKEEQGDLLSRTSQILRTQPEHITKTIKRFLDELDKFKGDLS